MTPYHKRRTPMTDRMAGDMRIRNLAQATIDAYTYHVGRFADFIQKPLGDATAEDVRDFQLYLIEEKKCRLEQLQPGRLWLTVSLHDHPPQALAGGHDPVRQAAASAAHRPGRRGS